jgi:transcriptional regulator with GAF, ATPase, and Fis domain
MDTDLLSDTFIELADTMVADFDVIDFLHLLTGRTVALLGAAAAGVLLAGPRGELRVAAASSEQAQLLELFQLQNDQGPCLECFRTGRPVTATGLAGQAQRWPRFANAALAAGFVTVEALPMRLRDQVIGALNLFRAEPGAFEVADLRIAQALADVATIGLLHERNVRRRETVAEQLQAALNSRVVIEQAKGKLAERLSIDTDRAFTMLRHYARNTNQHLTDVARDFITAGTAEFPPPARRPPRR